MTGSPLWQKVFTPVFMGKNFHPCKWNIEKKDLREDMINDT